MKEKKDITLILINELLKDKKKIAIYTFIFGVIGVIISFGIPRIYKSNVILAPETSNNNGFTGSISSLASMVGMDMNLGGDDAIYPEIYPDLMASSDFIIKLFPIKVTSLDGKIKDISYYQYLKKHTKSPWWTLPLDGINRLIESFKDDGENASKEDIINPFMLTKKQQGIVGRIRKDISCQVDKKTNVINITVTDQDPLIAATMADSVKNRLQVFITAYRTNKARNDQVYMEKLFAEAKCQYDKARQLYASYSDANQELLLQSYKAKQEDLENEMQLKYDIYTQVSQQLQLTKAKVQERTPAFTVVQSAMVPIRHSNKPKIMYLLAFMIIGFAIRTGYDIYEMLKKRKATE